MANPYEPVFFSLIAHEPAKRITPVSEGRNPPERKLADKVNKEIGSARFSARAFGEMLYREAGSQEERNEMAIAVLHFLYMMSLEVNYDMVSAGPEAMSRGYLAARIMDMLAINGYME